MYIVIEIQKINNNISTITNTYDNINEADNKFYTIVAAAAVSNVEKHSASMLAEEGYSIKNVSYEHYPE